MSFISLLWVLLLGSLLGLELIGKVPPTLHTPLMSGANAISGITMLAALTLIVKAEGNTTFNHWFSFSWICSFQRCRRFLRN